MNYNAVILMGVFAITGIWWVLHAIRHYPGPKVMTLYIHDDIVDGLVSQSGGATTEKKEE
jgi:hypothetical protein